MKKNNNATAKTSSAEVLRFAHPFYTNKPVEERPEVNGIGKRMNDYIKTQLEPIPVPIREPTMMLSEIIGDEGVTEVQQAGTLIFHAVGDTGTESGNPQQMVADAMTADYVISNPATSPAFFFHLGDVNYYENNDKGYHAQFYEPYKNYPGKIIAIPGNHDGELFKYDGTTSGQHVTLEAFQENFCQKTTNVPLAAGTIYREMIGQPGVYWYLNAPYADIIGLYSNMAENPGYISGPQIGYEQKTWFTQKLTDIAHTRKNGERKALLIATHHPPFSAGGHSSSTDMLIDIDDSCEKAGIMPDAFLSAHAHNIQCYTRYISVNKQDKQIPFIVCGGGGRPIQRVPSADGVKVRDNTIIESYHSFDKSIYSYGYLTITVTTIKLTINIVTVAEDGKKNLFDTIDVEIK